MSAHPRSRGENAEIEKKCPPPGGSSPLTRGKPINGHIVVGPAGLIPAHAGKTFAPRTIGVCLRAHPRSRGENHECFGGALACDGSSPLTRGKHRRIRHSERRRRLIPAHAGKTVQVYVGDREGGAHPRSRGENIPCASATCDARGSSPLTRGKRTGNREQGITPRLIPAHAGKTV